ncbi:MAG: DUF192 domain-containing protein [Spirochaetes bacterium]|nr:DUF192 domain-containing protein [Spirochaetota bacterium]
MKKNTIFIVIAIYAIFITAIQNYYFIIDNFLYAQSKKHCVIYILNGVGEQVPCYVELARTAFEHAKGLMNRSQLCNSCGMLFIFDDEEYRTFWMKDTKIPLSIAFIDSVGIINDIQDMKPFQTFPTYSSKYPAKYALEVNQGWFKKNNIKTGSKVIFNGCIGK